MAIYKALACLPDLARSIYTCYQDPEHCSIDPKTAQKVAITAATLLATCALIYMSSHCTQKIAASQQTETTETPSKDIESLLSKAFDHLNRHDSQKKTFILTYKYIWKIKSSTDQDLQKNISNYKQKFNLDKTNGEFLEICFAVLTDLANTTQCLFKNSYYGRDGVSFLQLSINAITSLRLRQNDNLEIMATRAVLAHAYFDFLSSSLNGKTVTELTPSEQQNLETCFEHLQKISTPL